MDAETAAGQMWAAYCEVVLGEVEYPKDFGDAQRAHLNLNANEIMIWD